MIQKQEIIDLLENDTLYKLIAERSELENILTSDYYLNDINRNKYYSPTDLAEWFDVTDGQIRYYIKPFFDYIFHEDEDTPLSEKTLRLGFKSILKVRMILLLKEEFKVNGLKHVLEDTPRLVKKTNMGLKTLDEDTEEIKLILKQILNTGVFEISSTEKGIEVNLSPTLKKQLDDTTKLQKLLAENNERAIAAQKQLVVSFENEKIALEERLDNHLEHQVALLEEAEKAYHNNFHYNILSKLFRSEHIEIEKRQFILDFIKNKKNA